MRIRHTMLVVTAALAVALPAHADEGLGVAAQIGSITSSSDGLTAVPTTPEWVAGICHYTARANVSGTLDVEYGGEAVAGSTTHHQPVLTSLTCTLVSPSLGLPGGPATRSASYQVACGGPACTALTSVASWPMRPLLICVDGYAAFGDADQHVVHSCKGATL